MKRNRSYLLFVIGSLIILIALFGFGCSDSKIVERKADLFASVKLLLSDNSIIQMISETIPASEPSSASGMSLVCRPDGSSIELIVGIEDEILLFNVGDNGLPHDEIIVEGVTGNFIAAVPLSAHRVCVVTTELDPSTLRSRTFYTVISGGGLIQKSAEIPDANNRNMIDAESDGNSKLFLLLDDSMLTLDIDSGKCIEKSAKGVLDLAYCSEDRFIVIEACKDDGRIVSEYNPSNGKTVTIITYKEGDTSIPEKVFVAGRPDEQRILLVSHSQISEWNASQKSLSIVLSASDKSMMLFPSTGILTMPDGRLILWGEYTFDSGNLGGLFEITFSQSPAEKQIIRLAAAYNDGDSDVQALAFLFNQNNPRYQIEIVYYGAYQQVTGMDTLNSAREDMVLNVLGESPPDMFYLPVSEISILTERDVLADIAPAIDSHINGQQQEFAVNALSASRKDGKQYWLSPFFTISGIVLQEKYINQLTDFSISGFQKFAVSKHISLFADQNPWSIYPVFETMYVDRENGTTSFHSNECLELIKEIEFTRSDSSDQGLIRFSTLKNFESFIHETQSFNAEITMIGYPQGAKQPPIVSASMGFGIHCNSYQKEGAIEFMDFLLSSTVQNMSPAFGYNEVPVLISAMDAHINSFISTASEDFQHGSSFDGSSSREESINLPFPSDGTWENIYRELLLSGVGFYLPDDCLRLIFEEEMYDYLYGERTAEEFLDILQNRVGIYIAERMKSSA